MLDPPRSRKYASMPQAVDSTAVLGRAFGDASNKQVQSARLTPFPFAPLDNLGRGNFYDDGPQPEAVK